MNCFRSDSFNYFSNCIFNLTNVNNQSCHIWSQEKNANFSPTTILSKTCSFIKNHYRLYVFEENCRSITVITLWFYDLKITNDEIMNTVDNIFKFKDTKYAQNLTSLWPKNWDKTINDCGPKEDRLTFSYDTNLLRSLLMTFVPSLTAFIASSSGKRSLTAVCISRLEMVDLLLYWVSLVASDANLLYTPFTKLLIIKLIIKVKINNKAYHAINHRWRNKAITWGYYY